MEERAIREYTQEEIAEKNRKLEEKIADIKQKLYNNGNELKFLIGDMIWQNRLPRRRMLSLVYKLPRVYFRYKRTHGPREKKAQPVYDDPYVYYEQLFEQKRQLRRFMRMNGDEFRFAMGNVIINSAGNLKDFFSLPFVLAKMWEEAEKQRREARAEMKVSDKRRPLGRIAGSKPVILFVATNGVGLGHLTRCLAIGKRVRELNGNIEVLFLTTSPALTVIKREGFVAYQIPSKEMLPSISAYQWNRLLKNMLLNVFELYDCRGIVYDGAIPYTPIVAVMAQQHEMAKIWVKRGRGKEEGGTREAAETNFDYIIVPGEAGAESAQDDEHHHFVAPILNLNREELWSRDEVRKFLKIPEGKLAVYVQLGAGNINDIDSDIYRIIAALRKLGNVVMVLGESLIGAELKVIEEDIIVIKDYPNSKYFNGFDFSVSACGYNSFHEMIYFGVPTLFIPNMNTKTDDQYGRAMAAQRAGAAFTAADLEKTDLEEIFKKLSDPVINERMRECACSIMQQNGAADAAEFIVDYVRQRERKE